MEKFSIGQDVWVRKYFLIAKIINVNQDLKCLRLSYGHENEMKTWFDVCDVMPIEHLLMDFIEIQQLHETHKGKGRI